MGGHAPTDQMNPEERAARNRNSLAIHSFSAVHRIASSRYMNASPRATTTSLQHTSARIQTRVRLAKLMVVAGKSRACSARFADRALE